MPYKLLKIESYVNIATLMVSVGYTVLLLVIVILIAANSLLGAFWNNFIFLKMSRALQAFSHFTYITAHSDSPGFPSLHLCHSLFSNPSLALPTSQLILQPFCCFTYVTAHSPTLLLPLLHHRIFTYVTWRAAHDANVQILLCKLGRKILKPA